MYTPEMLGPDDKPKMGDPLLKRMPYMLRPEPEKKSHPNVFRR
jgi:hypothetical protein